jgi:hypothetical protein
MGTSAPGRASIPLLPALRVLDRRVTDPGAEEEDGHPEPLDPDLLQVDDGARFPGSGIGRDDGGHGEDAQAGFQVLSPALAAVLPGTYMNGRRECAHRGRLRPLHRFLDDRRERNQGGLASRSGALAPQRNLVEDPLSQSAQPAVEGRVVRRVLSGGGRGGRPQAPGAGKVLPAQLLHPSQGELLIGKGIGGEYPPAGAAGVAPCEGHRQHQALSSRGDEGAADQGRRHLKRLGVAPCAPDAFQKGLDQSQIVEIDGPDQFGMNDRQHVRQRA